MKNNQIFVSRRGNVTSFDSSWSVHRNMTRYTPTKELSKGSFALIVGILTLVVGLIYVAQGAKATNFDYAISDIEDQISELEVKKESLFVEQARLTSLASIETSDVALNMEDAQAEGFAE